MIQPRRKLSGVLRGAIKVLQLYFKGDEVDPPMNWMDSRLAYKELT